MLSLRFAELALTTFLALVVTSLLVGQVTSPAMNIPSSGINDNPQQAQLIDRGACCQGSICWGQMSQAECSLYPLSTFNNLKDCLSCHEIISSVSAIPEAVLFAPQDFSRISKSPATQYSSSEDNSRFTCTDGLCPEDILCCQPSAPNQTDATTPACDIFPQTLCVSAGGYRVNSCTECGIVSAIPGEPVEYCCYDHGLSCAAIDAETCATQNGNPQVVSDCASCFQPEAVSCCLPDGSCYDEVDQFICQSWSGTPLAKDTLCSIEACTSALNASFGLPSFTQELSSAPETPLSSPMSEISSSEPFEVSSAAQESSTEGSTASSSSAETAGVCCNYFGGSCSATLGSFWCTILFGTYTENGTCAICQSTSSNSSPGVSETSSAQRSSDSAGSASSGASGHGSSMMSAGSAQSGASSEAESGSADSAASGNSSNNESRSADALSSTAEGASSSMSESTSSTEGGASSNASRNVSSAEETGACCMPNGDCFDLPSGSCALFGGLLRGGRSCTTYVCPSPQSSAGSESSGLSAASSAGDEASSNASRNVSSAEAETSSSAGATESSAQGGASSAVQMSSNGESSSNSEEYASSSAAGISQSSAMSSSSENLSSAAGSSSSEEKGNCCVEGTAFGLCFAKMPRESCENATIGGHYLGTSPCREAPAPGFNCGQVEPAGSSSQHSSSSSAGSCGDSMIDSALGEQCDMGPQNSDAPNAPCRTDCTIARCGDGIVDPSPSGRSEERCDDGALNSDTATARCRTDCRHRNVFYTLCQWADNLQLYSVNGTPIPDAPALPPSAPIVTIGLLIFLLL